MNGFSKRLKDLTGYSENPSGQTSFKVHKQSFISFGRYVSKVFQDRKFGYFHDPGDLIMTAFELDEDSFSEDDRHFAQLYFKEDFKKSNWHAMMSLDYSGSVLSKVLGSRNKYRILAMNLLRRANEDIDRAEKVVPLGEFSWNYELSRYAIRSARRHVHLAIEFPKNYGRVLELEKLIGLAHKAHDSGLENKYTNELDSLTDLAS